MRNLVLIGGGSFQNFENKQIHKKMIELTKKAYPSLLYIPVSDKSLVSVIEYFSKFDCLIKIYSNVTDIDDADIIYIGGGNTEDMLIRFRKLGILDKLLSHIDDKVIAGVSAGAIFWFKKYYSDTYSYHSNFTVYNYKMLPGINYFDACISPHFDEEGKECFSDYLDGDLGIGLENNTALIIHDETIDFILDRRHSAIYFYIDGKMNLLTKNNKNILEKSLL